jgi:tRNA(Arg) A34 adenosine deaminase TadA
MLNPFMKRAIELSREHMNLNQGGPFGAVVVKDGRIISEGWNNVTSSNDPTAHAEVTAIRQACAKLNTFDLHGCEIYTSCEPCPMCLAAIYWARIGKIFFANTRRDAASIQFDDEFLYHEINIPLEQRKIPMIQIDRSEAITVFEEWVKKPDKIQY